MKVYRRRQQNVGKWILAGLAFIMVMTLTFADVYGVGVPGKPGDGDRREPEGVVNQRTDDSRTQSTPDPAPVPEPATLILMAVGLGAAALMRSKKQA